MSDLVSVLNGCQVVWECLVIFYSQPELSFPQEKMVLHLIAESRFLIFFIFASVRFARFRYAPLRSASFKSAFFRYAPVRSTLVRFARFSFAREEWNVRTNSELTVTCDADNFYLKGKIEAFEDEKRVFDREWDLGIPRTVF